MEDGKAEDAQSLTNVGMEKEFVFCSFANTFLLLFIGLLVIAGSIVGIVAAVDPVGFGLEAGPAAPTVSPTESPTTNALSCRCVSKICMPTAGLGGGSPVQVLYPGDGSLELEGHNWCFVEDSCPTFQVGDNTTCVGAKFAFVDAYTATGFSDPRPIMAITSPDLVSNVRCGCKTLTCSPVAGADQGRTLEYPGDGSLRLDGKDYCFVEDGCPTTQLGTNETCIGEKFAFIDGTISPEYSDSYPVFAIPIAT